MNPLLIQAQRKLLQRITAHGGQGTMQAHFIVAQQETGECCTNYIIRRLKLEQLKLIVCIRKQHPENHGQPLLNATPLWKYVIFVMCQCNSIFVSSCLISNYTNIMYNLFKQMKYVKVTW